MHAEWLFLQLYYKSRVVLYRHLPIYFRVVSLTLKQWSIPYEYRFQRKDITTPWYLRRSVPVKDYAICELADSRAYSLSLLGVICATTNTLSTYGGVRQYNYFDKISYRIMKPVLGLPVVAWCGTHLLPASRMLVYILNTMYVPGTHFSV